MDNNINPETEKKDAYEEFRDYGVLNKAKKVAMRPIKFVPEMLKKIKNNLKSKIDNFKTGIINQTYLETMKISSSDSEATKEGIYATIANTNNREQEAAKIGESIEEAKKLKLQLMTDTSIDVKQRLHLERNA